MPTPHWIRAAGLADFDDRGPLTMRHDGKQIALFALPSGVHAIDRRCPHEGYPLTQGTISDGTLTCDWHNWKFRLADGTCSFGGEDVRSYPVEVRGGEVWVDVADPEREEIEPRLFADLREALGRRDTGRMARGVVRLETIGTPLAEVVAEGVAFGAPRMEYGWNHSLATLTDCLRLSAGLAVSPAALPVVQGLATVSDNEAYRPVRSRPDPLDPVAEFGSIGEALAAYPKLVDAEDAVRAEALMRGLIATGVGPARIRHAHLAAVTDHFLSYGHPLIYTQKAFDLLEAIGWRHADTVLSPLTPNAVLSTRYDRLPYMRRFMAAWHDRALDLDAVVADRGGAPLDAEPYRRALLDGSSADAFAAVAGALTGGVAVTALIDATAQAAAERFLRFDLDLDVDDTVDLGWLDVTHTLTTTHALRWAWSVDPSPEVLRGLLHAAWFVNWARRTDAPQSGAVAPRVTSDPEDLARAIDRRDAEAATAVVAGFDGDQAMLEATLARAGTADTAVSPIMVAHTVKTSRAAIHESRTLGSRLPLMATARFLASPRRERWVLASTNEALDLVAGRAKGDREG